MVIDSCISQTHTLPSPIPKPRELQRTSREQMGRSPCCSKDEVIRGAWTAAEDKTLIDYIKNYGEGKWRSLPKKAGLKRCGKSCRLRWLNYLRPGIKRGNITHDEEELIIRLHKLLGNRWSLIAGRLPGRTDNEVKNYWNTIIGKKLQNSQKSSSSREDHRRQSPDFRSNSDPGVVRTRASRCNQVTVPPELLNNDELHQLLNEYSKPIVAPTPALSISPQNDESPPEPLVPQFSADCIESSDLMMDFEFDEQFLSDFLDADFPQLTNVEHGAASSNQTNFFQENALLHEDSNFLSADSSIESEFDWVV